jgi:hypothetical protein
MQVVWVILLDVVEVWLGFREYSVHSVGRPPRERRPVPLTRPRLVALAGLHEVAGHHQPLVRLVRLALLRLAINT